MKDIIFHKGWEIDGREPMNHSPAFDYCRKLIKDGELGSTKLEVYRDEMLCLTIPSIEEGAKWAMRENDKKIDAGPRFIKYRPFPTDLKAKFFERQQRTAV